MPSLFQFFSNVSKVRNHNWADLGIYVGYYLNLWSTKIVEQLQATLFFNNKHGHESHAGLSNSRLDRECSLWAESSPARPHRSKNFESKLFLCEILSRLFWKIVKIAWDQRQTLGGSTILSQSLTSVMGACGLPSEKNSRNKCRWSIYPLIFILHHKRIHAINVTEIFEQEFWEATVGRVG